MFLSVIIATHKRPESMKELYNNLKLQTLTPNEIIIVDSSNDSNINYSWFKSNWELKETYDVESTLPKQRNIGISMLNNKSDIIIFLDDDVLLDNDYLKNINKIYEDDKINEIAGVGGFVIGQDENFKPFQTNPIIKNGISFFLAINLNSIANPKAGSIPPAIVSQLLIHPGKLFTRSPTASAPSHIAKKAGINPCRKNKSIPTYCIRHAPSTLPLSR
jgi:GT2 family glycosyltransferase